MTALDPKALGARAYAMISELGAISAEPNRLVRLFLTPEHRRAADLVAGWMRTAGLSVGEDALGTLRGRFGTSRRRLLIGSHIDTVIDAGKYDGPLGVIAGILAVESFARAKATLPFGIDVLAFGDEEGSRFPATLTSSSACAGVFNHDELAVADATGVTLTAALRAYGKSPHDIPAAAYRPQDAAGLCRGAYRAGAGAGSQGRAARRRHRHRRPEPPARHRHRRGRPRRHRADGSAPRPFSGAAEMALALEAIAREHPEDGMVGTVGRIEALPGAVNIIPGRVVFTVDLRALSDELRLEAIRRFQAAAEQIATTRGLTATIEPFHEIATAHCAPALQELLAASIEGLGHTPVRLPSGAGHDAQVMARLCPSAMLFVRCRGGVSHNPAEFASLSDMGLAVAALIGFIERFQPN